eukprot:806726-Prorocentrum_minimum.AAC.1
MQLHVQLADHLRREQLRLYRLRPHHEARAKRTAQPRDPPRGRHSCRATGGDGSIPRGDGSIPRGD